MIVKIVFLLVLIVFHFCMPIDDHVPMWDAQSQLNAAADYKAKECKQSGPPLPPLYVFTDQIKRNIDLCTIAITRITCPFDGYPIICLWIYMDKPLNQIPWQFNFNTMSNQKFKM